MEHRPKKRVKLGELLREQNAITPEQLEQALKEQKRSGRHPTRSGRHPERSEGSRPKVPIRRSFAALRMTRTQDDKDHLWFLMKSAAIPGDQESP